MDFQHSSMMICLATSSRPRRASHPARSCVGRPCNNEFRAPHHDELEALNDHHLSDERQPIRRDFDCPDRIERAEGARLEVLAALLFRADRRQQAASTSSRVPISTSARCPLRFLPTFKDTMGRGSTAGIELQHAGFANLRAKDNTALKQTQFAQQAGMIWQGHNAAGETR